MSLTRTTLEVEMNKLLNRLGDEVHIRHGQLIMVSWDKSMKPYHHYTLHRTSPHRWTIYLTHEALCTCGLAKGTKKAGRLRSALTVDASGRWWRSPSPTAKV